MWQSQPDDIMMLWSLSDGVCPAWCLVAAYGTMTGGLKLLRRLCSTSGNCRFFFHALIKLSKTVRGVGVSLTISMVGCLSSCRRVCDSDVCRACACVCVHVHVHAAGLAARLQKAEIETFPESTAAVPETVSLFCFAGAGLYLNECEGGGEEIRRK